MVRQECSDIWKIIGNSLDMDQASGKGRREFRVPDRGSANPSPLGDG